MEFDSLVMTLDDIADLHIEGLPATERGLRRYVKAMGWPVVYNEKGRHLILIDAVPEPFGNILLDLLRGPPYARCPSPAYTVAPAEVKWTMDAPSSERRMEARLMVIFEVLRRGAYVGVMNAIRGVVADAHHGHLPDELQRAVRDSLVIVRTYGKWVRSVPVSGRKQENTNLHAHPVVVPNASISFSTIYRWLKEFDKNGVDGLLPHDGWQRY